MAERATIFQGVQIGKEVTPGTSVAASKKLNSISIEPGAKVTTQQFKPLGTKMNTVSILNKEWAEAKISGVLDFNEITYLLASALTNATPTTATGESTWIFTPASASADAPVTYTIEQGSSVRAHKMTYGIVNELSFAFSRDELTIDGAMLGQKLTDGITMTGTPTSATQMVASAANVNVYFDLDSADIGTTKLTRALSGSWKLSDRYGPLWVMNSANGSFVTTVETEPKLEVTLMVEADAEGMGFLTNMRNGDTGFLRFEVTGPTITTNPYSFHLDTAIKFTDIGDFSDESGVYAVEYTATAVADATWGHWTQATIVNTLSAL